MFKNRTCKTGKLFCPKPTCTIYMFLGGRSVVVYSLFIVAAIICGEGCWPLFCYAIFCVLSSFAIILFGKRELITLLSLSS